MRCWTRDSSRSNLITKLGGVEIFHPPSFFHRYDHACSAFAPHRRAEPTSASLADSSSAIARIQSRSGGSEWESKIRQC
jgi:hypothetical protein